MKSKTYLRGMNRVLGITFFGGILLFMPLIIGSFSLLNNLNVSKTESRIKEILVDPTLYYNREVTIAGKIDDVIGSRSLTLDGPGAVFDDLLVISKKTVQPVGGGPGDIFREDDHVKVTGKVVKFDLKEFEKKLEVDLDDSQYSVWQGKPVILADLVEMDER